MFNSDSNAWFYSHTKVRVYKIEKRKFFSPDLPPLGGVAIMSAIRRRMHRITLILYTGLTIYYILYTILYYLLASLYTTLYILYCIIYCPHYILYSILYCIIYWPHCPAEDVVVFFGIISGFYVHQQNRTNFPLRCPFLLFSLSSLLFPF